MLEPELRRKLIDYAPTTSNVGIYADMVKDAAKRRDIIAIGTRIAQMGHANDADTDSIIGNALDEAFHIGEDDSSTDYKDIYTVSTDMLDHLDKIQKGEIAEGVHTGFRDIDDVTHGLQPADDRRRRTPGHGKVHVGNGLRTECGHS